MVEWDYSRRPASVLLLTRVGVEHGLTHAACLAGTGLSLAALDDGHLQVSARQEIRVIRNLTSTLSSDDYLALEVGSRYHLTTHGLWGFAIGSSTTVEEAISVGLRFIGLTWAFCRFATKLDAAGLRLVLTAEHLPSDIRRFLVLREMASVMVMGAEMGADPAAQVAICLRQHSPSFVQPYIDTFRTIPQFEAEEDYIHIPTALLTKRLPQADEHTRAMAEHQCRVLLARSRVRAGVSGRVRDALAASPHEMPYIEAVALTMQVSERTLRRRLAAEGTSYRALTDEVRELLAEELLSANMLSIEQISRRLGYTTTPAFSAAFSRWKGVSPRSFRSGL